MTLTLLVASAFLLSALVLPRQRAEMLALAVAALPLVLLLGANLADLPGLFSPHPVPTLPPEALQGKLVQMLGIVVVPSLVAWGLLARAAGPARARPGVPLRVCRISSGATITIVLSALVALGLGIVTGPFQATADTTAGLWSQVGPWLLLALSLAGALAEELLFRGVVYRSLARRSGGLAAGLVQATLFGAIHVSYGDPVYVVSATGFGLLQAYVVRQLGLTAAVAIHAQLNVVILGWASRGAFDVNALLVAGLLAANVFVAVSAGIACRLDEGSSRGSSGGFPS